MMELIFLKQKSFVKVVLVTGFKAYIEMYCFMVLFKQNLYNNRLHYNWVQYMLFSTLQSYSHGECFIIYKQKWREYTDGDASLGRAHEHWCDTLCTMDNIRGMTIKFYNMNLATQFYKQYDSQVFTTSSAGICYKDNLISFNPILIISPVFFFFLFCITI